MWNADELSSRKVLFVEDDVINQKVGVRMLKSFGCRVRVANNGLEGIQAMEEEDFDAVLLDCQMPVMDGFEATRKIRDMEAMRAGHIVDTIQASAAQVSPSSLGRSVDRRKGEQVVTPIHPPEVSGMARMDTGQSPQAQQSNEGCSSSDSDSERVKDDEDEDYAGNDDEGCDGEDDDDDDREEEGNGRREGPKGVIGHIPIIALTASAPSEYRRKCIDSGMDDWLPKPFDKTKLCHVLNKWLAIEGDYCSASSSGCGSRSSDCSD